MIDDGLRPIVTQFVAAMLNDPRCESILLDVGEDARETVICPSSTWTSPGNGTGALSPSWVASTRRAFETPTRTKQ